MTEKTQKIYSRNEAYEATLKYFNGDDLATDVWINKYCLKDSEGNLFEKTPEDMHRRLAKEFSRIENNHPNPVSEDEIFDSLKNFNRIVPQGSPMAGIGNNLQITSLSNCFVVGNPENSDSYGGIMKMDQEIVQLQKRRAGVGCDISYIRPKGTPVKNSAMTSTGVVPFMERYSNTTKECSQGGRRGALMITISIKHPDAEDFIDAKTIQGKVTGANVSVRLDDEFLKAVENDDIYMQKFPVDFDEDNLPKLDDLKSKIKSGDFEHGVLYNVGKNKFVKIIDAKKLWKRIIHNAWKSAEPGLLFWDTILNESIADCYDDLGFKTICVNPCGEITLSDSDSCRLLALNLYGYVTNPYTKNSGFDLDLFKKDVFLAQRLMDDIIDLEIEKINNILKKIDEDPEPELLKIYEKNLWERIKKAAINGRRTGLGVTGEGDMLAALGYTYGTDEANYFAERIHNILKLVSYRSSVELAKERGSFPIYDSEREKNNPFINRIKKEDPDLYRDMVKYGRRNISLLTIAPTGSVSILTQTTSGIECVFLPIYMRRRKINPEEKGVRIDFIDSEGIHWTEYPVFHHKFKTWLEINGFDVDVVKTMTKAQINEIVKKSPYYKSTSNDVDWVKKVEMQGMIQKHVDHSISVTVNIPNDTSEDIVSKIYETGWKHGCKGITVYRDGSRDGVLISSNDNKDDFKTTEAPKRPKRLKGEIFRFQNNLEKWIAVVGLLDGKPYEIFTGKNENGLADLPNNVKFCEVVKNIIEDSDGNKRKRYDIEFVNANNEKQIVTGLNHAFNPEFWNYSKLISGVMRHGMQPIHIFKLVDSLNLKDDNLNTWKNGVARVIKKFIKDGERFKGRCDECGSENLEFRDKCPICLDCGSSRCG